MERLTLAASRQLETLVVGAHADDIERGASGTILRLLDDWLGSRITWVIATITARASRGATRQRSGVLRRRMVERHETHFPSQRGSSWWGGDTVWEIARRRGIETATPLAEAFHARKLVN